jgi:hypothetical protein
VTCLKKALGQQVTTSTDIPSLDEEGILVSTLERIVDVREQRLRSRVIREYLIIWKGFLAEDATWEGEHILQHPDLKLLEDKQFREGRIVMYPSN